MDTFEQIIQFLIKKLCICFSFKLSAAVRQGIVDTLERALSDQKVKSVVICGRNGIFCGGMVNVLFLNLYRIQPAGALMAYDFYNTICELYTK